MAYEYSCRRCYCIPLHETDPYVVDRSAMLGKSKDGLLQYGRSNCALYCNQNMGSWRLCDYNWKNISTMGYEAQLEFYVTAPFVSRLIELLWPHFKQEHSSEWKLCSRSLAYGFPRTGICFPKAGQQCPCLLSSSTEAGAGFDTI